MLPGMDGDYKSYEKLITNAYDTDALDDNNFENT
jgi:hypothetical protein